MNTEKQNLELVHMGPIEFRFAEYLWEHEPIRSSQMVKGANERFGWAKATAFTVLRRLSERGIFQNNHGVITSLMSKDEYAAIFSAKIVENEAFKGSLPSFVAAFTSVRKISENEKAEILRIIENAGNE